MPKLRLNVSKLENPTAEFISLVHRPANRIPFRIIKQQQSNEENDMLNLSDPRIFTKKAEDANQPAESKGQQATKQDAKPIEKAKLVGFVVEKGEAITEDVKKALAEAGVKVFKAVENADDTVYFDQEAGEGELIVKMNPHALAVFGGVDAETIVKGTRYESLYNEIGFLPSIEDARASAEGVVKTKLASEGGYSDACSALNDAQAYDKALRAALPDNVFKAAEIVAKAFKAKPKPAGQAAMDGVPDGKDKEPDADETKKAEADAVDCPVCKGEKCAACAEQGKVTKEEAETLQKAFVKKPKPMNDGDPEDAKDGGADEAEEMASKKATKSQEGKPAATMPPMDQEVQKSLTTMAETLAQVQKSVTEIAGAVANVAKAQGELATEVAGVKATATKAQETASKAEAAVKGAVIGGVPPADNEEGKVAKSEERGTLGVIDTAFQPHVRRVSKYEDRVAATRMARR